MCGVFGLFSSEEFAGQEMFDALTVLQHRGQDAAGIATCQQNGKFHIQKGNGLVRDVIRSRHIYRLKGNMAIGHVRYPTAGCSNEDEAQPFYVNSPFGVTLAHNGNLTNAEQLAKEVFETDLRHLSTHSDSEVLLNVFAHELASQKTKVPSPEDIFSAISATHKRISGGYAVVGIIANVGIFAFRDPHGIRPLCFGTKKNPGECTQHAIASESVVLAPLGFSLERDIAPGEALFINTQGKRFLKQCAKNSILSPCLFELVYMARPDSIMDEISVYKSRLRMGEYLARKIQRTTPNLPIDVVIPIPDTSRTSAMKLAHVLDKKYREGFIKNRYIGRTFIMPGQKVRRKSVHYKLSAIDLEFKGKNVLLVDDSIVRGTTSKEIICMARKAGAKKVYIASASPPVRHPNVYGIDMPTRKELIAHNATEEEIKHIIGADEIFYQDIKDLVLSVQEGNSKIKRFDDSCFTGKYITKDVSEEYLKKIESARNTTQRNEENPITLL
jgi:amidophosphoribosyltransferase